MISFTVALGQRSFNDPKVGDDILGRATHAVTNGDHKGLHEPVCRGFMPNTDDTVTCPRFFIGTEGIFGEARE